MKILLPLFCLLVGVAYAATIQEEENPLEAPEQARACVGTNEKCTEGDDCSCCGVWDKCGCNNPNEYGVCRCMRAMIYTNWKKRLLC